MTTWTKAPRPFTEGQTYPNGARWAFTFTDATGVEHRCTDYPDRDSLSAGRTCLLFCATIGQNGGLVLRRYPQHL